ncbi:N-acetylmuramoyl-L-alanine amidase [Patescibacteria group bacterium]|nr:N-acetylmuramoyl-L-alanine amidase [Patescibacteria group bacterium]
MGAHAKYNNTDSIGIALLGNFEVGKPTDVQLAALTKLITALSIKYKIHPDNQIYAHIEDDA